MTAPGRYAASDDSFARSAGSAAARGGVLIGIALLLGLLLLWQGFDGGDPAATIPPDVDVDGTTDDTGDTSGDTGDPADDGDTDTGDDATTGDDAVDPGPDDEGGTSGSDPSTDPVEVDPPGSVKVAVMNGRGEPGLSTARAGVLQTAGYVAVAVNAASFDTALSTVYYTTGYEDEAKVVAEALNGGSSVLDVAPADPLALVEEDARDKVTDFHIFVMLGADEALG